MGEGCCLFFVLCYLVFGIWYLLFVFVICYLFFFVLKRGGKKERKKKRIVKGENIKNVSTPQPHHNTKFQLQPS